MKHKNFIFLLFFLTSVCTAAWGGNKSDVALQTAAINDANSTSTWQLCYQINGESYSIPLSAQENNYYITNLSFTQGQTVTFHLEYDSQAYGPKSGNCTLEEGNQDGSKYSQNNYTYTFTPQTTGVYTFVMRHGNSKNEFQKIYVFPEEATYKCTGSSTSETYISARYPYQKIKVVFENFDHSSQVNESCFNMYAHAEGAQFTIVFKGNNKLYGWNHGGIKIPKTPHQEEDVILYKPTITITAEETATVDFGSTYQHKALQDELGTENASKKANFVMDKKCMYLYFEGSSNVDEQKEEFIPEDVSQMAEKIKQLGAVKMLLAKPYVREVKTENYGTICLPYDSSRENNEWENIENVYSIASISGESIELEEVSAMQKGMPYIFKASNTPIKVSRHDATFAKDAGKQVIGDNQDNYLQGVYYNKFAPVNSYVLQDNTFCKVATADKIKLNYRAYLTTTDPSASQLSIMKDGEPTAIDALNEILNGNAEIYDLSGHRLNVLQKGINIVNGKKIIVR